MKNVYIQKVDTFEFCDLEDHPPYVENGSKNTVIFTDESIYLESGMIKIDYLLQALGNLKDNGCEFAIVASHSKWGYEVMGVAILDEDPNFEPNEESRFEEGQEVFVLDSIYGLTKVTIDKKVVANRNWYYILSKKIYTSSSNLSLLTNQIHERRLMIEGDFICGEHVRTDTAKLTKELIEAL